MLKTVLKGIPVDITEDEIESNLESLGFKVKLIRRFGSATKPIPICLVILFNDSLSSENFNLTSLFYINISVEFWPISMFCMSAFWTRLLKLGHAQRCMKCSGNYAAKNCEKSLIILKINSLIFQTQNLTP